MTERDDTEAAPTAAADSETTELPPATHAANASAEAWSLDDTAEGASPHRASRLVWSGLVALVVAVVGALIFLGTTLFSSAQSKPVEPPAKSSATISAAAPPPPPITVTAPPPLTSVQAAPAPSTDDLYLQELSNRGVMFQDRFTAKVAGHDACGALLQNHDNYQTQQVMVTTYGLTVQQANAVVAAGHMYYCPQAADAPPRYSDGD